MALLRVDWNPDQRKVRQFGIGLVFLAAALGALSFWRGRALRAELILALGIPAGIAAAAWPASLGRRIYLAWMSVSFVIGMVVSNMILAAIYYGMLAPLGIAMRLGGRDALRLKKDPKAESEWVPLAVPVDKTYFERLY